MKKSDKKETETMKGQVVETMPENVPAENQPPEMIGVEDKFIKYIFDESEKRRIATQMAEHVAEKAQADSELKAVKSQFKSRIDALESNINLEASHLTTGYEMKNFPCRVYHDYHLGMVTWYRNDTMEKVGERAMTDKERQRKLFDE